MHLVPSGFSSLTHGRIPSGESQPLPHSSHHAMGIPVRPSVLPLPSPPFSTCSSGRPHAHGGPARIQIFISDPSAPPSPLCFPASSSPSPRRLPAISPATINLPVIFHHQPPSPPSSPHLPAIFPPSSCRFPPISSPSPRSPGPIISHLVICSNHANTAAHRGLACITMNTCPAAPPPPCLAVPLLIYHSCTARSG